MAGSRPSAFKKGGGFLNNVAGVIADYEFTTEFPGQDKRSKKGKGDSEFNPLYFLLTAQVDGAEEPQTTTMFAGDADEFEIEDDGKTLNPVDDNVGIRGNTDFGRFLTSLVSPANGDGFPEENLPEDGEPINYEAIVGTRVQFVQVKDEEAMAKAAKKWRQSGGKFNEQGQKKSKKDGKYYNLQYLTVGEVLALPGEAPAKSVKGKSSAASKSTNVKAANGKANGKAVDLDELAKDTLLAILANNDNSIAKSKLPQQIAKKLGVKHPHREEIRKLIYSDDFLTTEDGWTYDQSSKQQTIELAE